MPGFYNQQIKTGAVFDKAIYCSVLRILQSNKNKWLLFAVSPSATPDLSQLYEFSLSVLDRELKGTNDSCCTDGSALRICENMCFKDNEGRRECSRFNPSLSDSPNKDGGQQGMCHGRLIQSGYEHVYQPSCLHTEAYAARMSKRFSVQMAFVENHIRLLLSRVNSCWHWLRGCKAVQQ